MEPELPAGAGPAPAEPGPGSTTATAGTILARYRRVLWQRAGILLLLALACAACFGLDLVTGTSAVGWRQSLLALADPEGAGPTARIIIWNLRLPGATIAVLVGAALALAGAEMQTILNNPLASPFTLGVSSAASFGAALAIVLGIGLPAVPAPWLLFGNAFLFAFGSVLLLQAMAGPRGAGSETLVLLGIALVFTFNAGVGVIQFVASQEDLQQLVFWTLGSLARADWPKTAILAAVFAAVVPFSLAAAWRMTALRLGEDRAASFGVDVARLRFAALLRVSLLAATSVACVGTIGFIGLVGPHIGRLLVGEDHRFFLPASLLTGACLLSLSSTAAKLLIPGVVMPVGLVTSLIGVPCFIALILSRRGRE
ncbi:MAG: iron chelate uptake ABC transporter family permease subunit [Azospirillum sp.]|nr:iron chelate uptake ABC transporter family permease subunit [Azospirillum sp.]